MLVTPARMFAPALALAISACGSASGTASGESVVFEGREFDHDSTATCNAPDPCAIVRLSWLEATGGSRGVARRMNAHVLPLLGLTDGGTKPSNSPKAIATAFQTAYMKFQASNPRSRRPWELKAAVGIPWRSPQALVTFRAVTYKYVGGAYGFGEEWYGVIDARSGRRLALREILLDSAAASEIVERQFRREKHLPSQGSLSEHGWWFAEDRFALTPNIGLSADGVVFHWNPYLIGPHSAGPTTIVVPYDSLQTALAKGIAP